MDTTINDVLARLTGELTSSDGIDLMYYDIKNYGEVYVIILNIISSYENILEDKELSRKVISRMEIIKQLLGNNERYAFNFNYRGKGAFNRDTINDENIVFAKAGIINAKTK